MSADEQQLDLREHAEELAEQIRKAGGSVFGSLYTDLAGVRLLLGVAERTLRDWRSQGRFPAGFQAHRILIDIREIVLWIETQKSAAATGEHRQHDVDNAMPTRNHECLTRRQR